MRKARLKVIISGRARIRTRSAYWEFPRPSEGCVYGKGGVPEPRQGVGGDGGESSGGSEVGSFPL